jgi:hypothetical protein
MAYIYKWDGQKWGAPVAVEDVTLRGITALDRYGAWACGFTSRGSTRERGVIMSWDYATQTWTRHNINVDRDGYTRLTSILAIDYNHLYIAGYTERADEHGTDLTGLEVYSVDVVNANNYKPLLSSWNTRNTDSVARFYAMAGLSPSTVVAVGAFKPAMADTPPDGPSPGDLGYPAVAWWRDDYVTPQKVNVSIAHDLEVTGVAMKYV